MRVREAALELILDELKALIVQRGWKHKRKNWNDILSTLRLGRNKMNDWDYDGLTLYFYDDRVVLMGATDPNVIVYYENPRFSELIVRAVERFNG